MDTSRKEDIQIVNTTKEDWEIVIQLFEQALKLQGVNSYKVWDSIDLNVLEKEMLNKLQYKIVRDDAILCIFSVQFKDPYIWRSRDRDDAIYLHRIVVNPLFKGQKQFQKVLTWAMDFARLNNLSFIRMDTWADNLKIIDYYKSFGFEFIEYYRTSDEPGLPVPNRNLDVALLEIRVS
jgi:ribosomal protein S18 acetylase RimI-like enzyme